MPTSFVLLAEAINLYTPWSSMRANEGLAKKFAGFRDTSVRVTWRTGQLDVELVKGPSRLKIVGLYKGTCLSI